MQDLKSLTQILLNSDLLRSFDPNPENHPEVVYKFRNWKDAFHKNVIINNELFMAPPSSLNDPFDCRIIENYHYNLKSQKNKDTYISKSLEEHSQEIMNLGLSEDEAKRILTERINDPLYYQCRAEYISKELDDKHLGITCFSEKWDSILMWSHYGDNHRGYCIGFDEKRLRYMDGRLKRVQYSNDYPEINPLVKSKNSADLKYFYKSKDWQYEEEVRLMKIFKDDTSEKFNSRVINFENNFIKEIVLGLQIDKSAKQEIISIAKDKSIPVWQTVRSEFQFKIERYQL